MHGHGVAHFRETGHCVLASFSDFRYFFFLMSPRLRVRSSPNRSFWCYSCDSYVVHPSIDAVRSALHRSKFGDKDSQSASSGWGAASLDDTSSSAADQHPESSLGTASDQDDNASYTSGASDDGALASRSAALCLISPPRHDRASDGADAHV